MTFDNIQTDPRLKYLLDSGENLLRLTDPEGVCGSCRVSRYTITFDDSVIQDKSAIRKEARDDVQAGLMSRYRYLTEIAGLGEDDANEELARIRAESSVTAEAIDFFSVNNAE